MFSFSLTNEQKKAALQTTANNLEMEVYHMLLGIGEDPDTYDFNQIASLADRENPSNEYRLYKAYNRLIDIRDKISKL